MWNANRSVRLTSSREVGFSRRLLGGPPLLDRAQLENSLGKGSGYRLNIYVGYYIFVIVVICHGASYRGVRLTGDPAHVLTARDRKVSADRSVCFYRRETVLADGPESGPKRFSHKTRPAHFSAIRRRSDLSTAQNRDWVTYASVGLWPR